MAILNIASGKTRPIYKVNSDETLNFSIGSFQQLQKWHSESDQLWKNTSSRHGYGRIHCKVRQKTQAKCIHQ